MASTFNLTAQLNLRGPANIRAVVVNIRRQIGTIDANVNIVVILLQYVILQHLIRH
jgi:hypothetical protein